MKKLTALSLTAAVALSASLVQADALSDKLAALEKEIATLKKQIKKNKKKINTVKAHDSGDNIKWNVDFRTAYDRLNYDMADGSKRKNNTLFTERLWLNMSYSPDNTNVFMAQLAMNKAFGAEFGQTPNPTLNPFGMRGAGFDTFDWISNEALSNNTLHVRQAFWLYLGDSFLGTGLPWTFSIGRRPSTNGFLASLREDDSPQSPLGHIINVEFDGLSSKVDLSSLTGVPGMSIKLCMGQGSSNAAPLFGNLAGTSYQNDSNQLKDVKLAGFIFEPYNDGQYIVKTTWYKAWSLPGFDSANFAKAFNGQKASFSQNGNMYGAAISAMVDGLTEEGILADTKLFASFAWSKTDPDSGKYMLGVDPTALNFPAGTPGFGAKAGEAKSGTSYWVGAQIPVIEGGKLGLEYNHGSKYWRPFDYGEDTMVGSKLAARGSAWEAYFTYQINDALSAQIRYTSINYDYTGSNGFFGAGGTPLKISDLVKGAQGWDQFNKMMGGTLDPTKPASVGQVAQALVQAQKAPDMQTAGLMAGQMALAKMMTPNIVDKAQDLRFYLRYRF